MSMSQEEIESLMNGLDLENEVTSEDSGIEDNNEVATSMSEDDINELIAQTEDIGNIDNNQSTEESVDELLSNLENINTDVEEPVKETNIDDIIKEFEKVETSTEEDATVSDTILNTEDKKEPELELIEDETILNSNDETLKATNEIEEFESQEKNEEKEQVSSEVFDETFLEADNSTFEDIDKKINNGVFPLPVENDTKVVNQLSQVANDSEEKATKIFDVLSNILDYNDSIQNDVQALHEFNTKQLVMLNSLANKFPNIETFKINLDQAQEMGNYINNVNEKINNGNTEIFQAMELMQFHDINRQKIERVMSVIRKLSIYLNNLFEDEKNREEIAVANHIHGDDTEDLVADDDLEALIAEFNK